MSTEDFGQIIPFSNIVRYVPKDNPSDGIYPTSYYIVSENDISNSSKDLNIDIQQPISLSSLDISASGKGSEAGGGAGGTDGLDSLIPVLGVSGPTPTFLNVNENTSATFTVDVTLTNDNTTVPTYQWQKQESGTTVWNNINGATSASFTTSNTVFANDYLDQYRCIVSAKTAANTPVTSQSVTLNVRRVITILTQPSVAASYFSGEQVTLSVGANITSGNILYQWQRKDVDETLFTDIPTASGATYTTPSLSLQSNNFDIYRCVLTNTNADPKITNEVQLNLKGADLKVTPAVTVSGVAIRFWSFLQHGPLILDSANSTSYQIECLENSKNVKTDMWGQGSCNSRGGYSAGSIPMTVGQIYTVKLNAGAGSGGNAGGGYAGVFTGTTISQANALLVAGGAGGGGKTSTLACTFSGGTGGALTGGSGTNASASVTGGGGGTQSAGGTGGNNTSVTTVTNTNTYSTAGTYTLTIPSDATNITYQVVGGTGGKGGDAGAQTAKAGGRGQKITGTLTNVAGQTLTLVVGSNGSNGSGGRDVAGGAGGSGYKIGGSGGRSSPLSVTSTVTNTYTTFGTVHSLSIPSTISTISFELAGGRGGNGGISTVLPVGQGISNFQNRPGGQGAFGQKVFATPSISSVAGKTLSLYVGENGWTSTGNNGFDTGAQGGTGYNSGGRGGDQLGGETWGTAGGGGGGGGSSAVVDGTTPIVIAGGGGGGGGSAASSEGDSSTTSTLLATDTNYGNGSQGGWGSDSGNGASGGGGGGHGNGYVGGGIGGRDNNAGNHLGGFAGQSGGAYYSTSYISSASLASTSTGGYVTVQYSILNSNPNIASGGGGGGSSAISIGNTLLIESGGGGGSGGAATTNTAGTPVASTSLGTINNSSNGSNGDDSCSGYTNSGAGGGGGGNAGGSGGTSQCSGAEVSGGGGSSGKGYYNNSYVTGATVTTGTTDAQIVITYNVPTKGTDGSALQGGTGGSGTYVGGGGGGGYWGGGAGAGTTATSGSSAGGGGSGFVASSIISGVTSAYVATVSGVSRGTAGDINGGSRTVFNLNTIVITQQPTVLPEYLPGDTVNLSITATITNNSVINYQWQRKIVDSTIWTSISGATSSAYSIPDITLNDYNLNSFRCVLTNSNASDVISNEVTLNISGADLKITPAVSGVTFWTFSKDGSLVLDASNSVDYSIIPLNADRSKLITKMWGQGSCSTAGGYSAGHIPIIKNNTYAVKLNAGAGSGGTPVSGGSSDSGGGYAGIFNGTTISQANALMIAGGAGGDGLSSTDCTGTTEVTESISTSTTVSLTQEGGLYHERSGGVDQAFNFTGAISSVARDSSTFIYTFYFSQSFDSSNYSLSVSNVSAFQGISANGTVYSQGFSASIIEQTSSYFKVRWNVQGQPSSYVFVRYQTFTAIGDKTYSSSSSYTASPRVLGGSGGGTTANNGTTPNTSLISAEGGNGGSQLSGGTGGTTTLGGSYNGSNGSALQGGTGGAGSKSGSSSYGAAGGGGGGGGYWGGGGGGGGSNQSTGIRPGGGGGGGSGFVAATVVSGSTSTTPNLTDANRGTAGTARANSRIVIDPAIIVINTQPSSTAALENSNATFSVSATISGVTGQAISYQWQRLDVGNTTWTTITGATNSSYTKTSVTTAADNGDKYRCVLTNAYTGTVITNEVYLYVGQSTKIVISNPGTTTYTIPSTAQSVKVKMWGAGGELYGECNNAGYAGGTGGFTSLKHTVTSGQVLTLKVGSTGEGSDCGECGYGAGKGGDHSALYIDNVLIGVAGGGGGAGQAGFGGGGSGASAGANVGTGGSGTGSYAGSGGGQSSGGSGNSGGVSGSSLRGGAGGGTGINIGNRGGGGGSGYYGGGGGGGIDGNCSGSGGGGGSGWAKNTATEVVGINGAQGITGGALAVNRTDPDYVSGIGGSNQNGLVVIELTLADLTISPAVNGITDWSFAIHGALILDSSNATSYTITPKNSFTKITKAWGQGATSGTQQGGYASGNVAYGAGNTYQVRLNAGSGGNRAGGYAGIFISSVSQSNTILIGSGGGGPASQTTGPGTYLGTNGPGGNATSTAGGTGYDAIYDNYSSANGSNGGALSGGAGGPAGIGYQSSLPTQPGFWYYYGQGTGGGGGGGYWGGGGGGGGTAVGNAATTDFYNAPGNGGRGISFANSVYVSGGSASETPVNASNRGTAGNVGAGSRVVIEP